MLKYNKVEHSQSLQVIYWHWIFSLCFWVDFRLRFVNSSLTGSSTLCRISKERRFL